MNTRLTFSQKVRSFAIPGRHKNRVVSKNALAENIPGDDAYLYDNLDVIYAHMKNLKRELANASCPD